MHHIHISLLDICQSLSLSINGSISQSGAKFVVMAIISRSGSGFSDSNSLKTN